MNDVLCRGWLEPAELLTAEKQPVISYAINLVYYCVRVLAAPLLGRVLARVAAGVGVPDGAHRRACLGLR